METYREGLSGKQVRISKNEVGQMCIKNPIFLKIHHFLQ